MLFVVIIIVLVIIITTSINYVLKRIRLTIYGYLCLLIYLVIWYLCLLILITHDGSMVLVYMVLHGSHQYTPFMLAVSIFDLPAYMDPSWVINILCLSKKKTYHPTLEVSIVSVSPAAGHESPWPPRWPTPGTSRACWDRLFGLFVVKKPFQKWDYFEF